MIKKIGIIINNKMEINFDLQNGNILLELKKAIEKEYYLVLTDTSFFRACEKSIGKITPTEKKNETKQNLFIYSITMF
jgi:hypothetical protein